MAIQNQCPAKDTNNPRGRSPNRNQKTRKLDDSWFLNENREQIHKLTEGTTLTGQCAWNLRMVDRRLRDGDLHHFQKNEEQPLSTQARGQLVKILPLSRFPRVFVDKHRHRGL